MGKFQLKNCHYLDFSFVSVSSPPSPSAFNFLLISAALAAANSVADFIDAALLAACCAVRVCCISKACWNCICCIATACCIIIGREEEASDEFTRDFWGSDLAISTFNGRPATSILFNAKAAVASSGLEYSMYAKCFESVMVHSTTVPQKLKSCFSCSTVRSGLRLLTCRVLFRASPFPTLSSDKEESILGSRAKIIQKVIIYTYKESRDKITTQFFG